MVDNLGEVWVLDRFVGFETTVKVGYKCLVGFMQFLFDLMGKQVVGRVVGCFVRYVLYCVRRVLGVLNCKLNTSVALVLQCSRTVLKHLIH